jgi:hypothetical protein
MNRYKRNYETVTVSPVNMCKLRNSLGFKHKLPLDLTFLGEMELFDWRGDFMQAALVKIIPAIKQGKPRVFVFNRNQNKWVPAGRTAQAKK